MKMKNTGSTLIMVIMCILMVACGPGNKKSNAEKDAVDASKFPIETSNNDPAVKDAGYS